MFPIAPPFLCDLTLPHHCAFGQGLYLLWPPTKAMVWLIMEVLKNLRIPWKLSLVNYGGEWTRTNSQMAEYVALFLSGYFIIFISRILSKHANFHTFLLAKDLKSLFASYLVLCSSLSSFRAHKACCFTNGLGFFLYLCFRRSSFFLLDSLSFLVN